MVVVQSRQDRTPFPCFLTAAIDDSHSFAIRVCGALSTDRRKLRLLFFDAFWADCCQEETFSSRLDFHCRCFAALYSSLPVLDKGGRRPRLRHYCRAGQQLGDGSQVSRGRQVHHVSTPPLFVIRCGRLQAAKKWCLVVRMPNRIP